MKKKILLIPLALLLAIGLVATGCPAPAPAPAHEIVTIDFYLNPLGSVAYTMGLGLSELIEKEHPWLRLNAVEGPGATANTYNMLTNPEYSNIMASTGPSDYYMAANGMALFEKEGPFPDVLDKIGYFGNYFIGTVGLYTLDPDIKTEKDLVGKRVALGKIGQIAWGLLPTVVLEDIAEIDVALDYLKPKTATGAMIDGKADAAAICIVHSPDFSVVRHTSAIIDLLAAGKEPYWISWSDELMEKGIAEGWGPFFNPIQVPAGVFPGDMRDPLYTTDMLVGWGASVDFPEELAYEFTKFYIENSGKLSEYTAMADTIAKPEWLTYAVLKATESTPERVFHPGALRAYKEAGIPIE